MKKIYYIIYDNGGYYEDHWSGILESSGFFLDAQKAEDEVVRLKKEHDLRIASEIESGEAFPHHENETFRVGHGNLIE